LKAGYAERAQARPHSAACQNPPRDKSQSTIFSHKGKLELVVVRFHRNNHVEVGVQQRSLQRCPSSAAPRIQNPLHSREILNFLRRRPIFSRSYDDEPVFAQWRSNYLGRQLLPLGSKNEGCVQSPCAHAFQQFAAPSGAEPERDLWKLGSNPPERFGNSKLSQSVRHTDSYFPGREVAGG